MTKPQIKEFNCETGVEIVRDATPDEIAQLEIDEANYLAAKAIADTEAKVKAAQRQALLNRLGLSEEEARILLGGN